MSPRLSRSLAAFALAVTPSLAFSQTTTMDFSTIGGNNFDAISQSFGDNANLNVTNRTRSGFGNAAVSCAYASLWNAGYSDLTAAAFSCNDGAVAEFFFQPLNGTTVFLNSLQFGSWDSNGTCCGPVRRWTYWIYDSDWTLLDNGGGALASTFTATSNASSSTGLYVQYGTDWNVGANNITTTVGDVTTTPEPASLALFGTGLIGLVGVRRIRRRA